MFVLNVLEWEEDGNGCEIEGWEDGGGASSTWRERTDGTLDTLSRGRKPSSISATSDGAGKGRELRPMTSKTKCRMRSQ